LYVAALLCKPMAVSFPFVMLAMDYYPLQRYEQLGWGRLIREKAPWITLAVASSVATVISKSHLGNVIPLETVRPSFRVFLALKNLTFYPLKLVWPSHLSPTYLVPASISIDDWAVSGPVLSVLMITAFAVIERRRAPILAAAWGAYVMLVLPVSGLMLTVPQAVATRFAYVAILPLLLLGGGTAVWVWRRSASAVRVALIGLLAAQLCAFGVRTRSLVPVWRNDETKADAVLADSPDTEEGNRTVTSVLLDRGRAGEALPYAQRGVELAPQLWPAHMMLGLVLERLGQLSEAIAQYEQVLRMNPDVVEVQYNCGVALAEAGRVPEAITHYQQALRLKPDYIDAHINLGNALLRTGKVQEAVEQYGQALRIDPDSAEAHSNLGAIYQRMGKLPEAVTQYEQALRSKPDYVEAHFNLGLTLEKLGRTREAIEQFKLALEFRPNFTPAKNALARLGAGQ
jgi:tetratricopeptide (TPR) repeat protein